MSEVTYPCPEKNWENLEGESKESRFCELCLKKVYAQKRNEAVHCGVDNSTGMSYQTFLARFAAILFFVFGSGLFVNASNCRSLPNSDVAVYKKQTAVGQVRGTVKDADSGELIPFAVVYLTQNGVQKAATQTDLDGRYVFNVAPGDYEILVKYIGYNELKKADIKVTSDKTVIHDFVMEQDQIPIVGIIIEPRYELEDHRSKTFRREEIQRHPKK